MLLSVPDYYKEFHCIADRCEDTCCAGWQIVVDPKALKKYKAVCGPYRKTLKRKINWRQSVFRQDKERRCAFLQDDNLCEMYRNLGEKSLCRTCRRYPRHIEEFEDVRELTLSVSCPEVARILMNRMEPVRFLTKETEREENYEEFDLFLYSQLLDAREVILEILQDRTLPVKQRMGLVYGIAHDMQRRVNRQELFSCGEVLEKYQKDSAREYVAEQIREKQKDKKAVFRFSAEMFRKLFQLEVLKTDWEDLLLETENRLFASDDPEEYRLLTEEFENWMKLHQPQWEIQKEQLLVYFISTYFCGAVYDGELLAKTQMAILSIQYLEEFLKIRWLRNEKEVTIEDVIELVYRYSREVEHSDLNLKRMEEMMPVEHALF